jgi:predicted glycosyltransferase/peptidoglycan/xylan/chitin deacetylase (PgdA/CDA1 family)
MSDAPAKRPLTVLVVVTHLLGVGHLARAASLARALAAAGHGVTLASGGRPAPLVRTPGVELVQLPPLHCVGADFRTLLDEAGEPAGERLLAERGLILLGLVASLRPDVVVTELYPFGRRQLAGEFSLLVDAAMSLRPRPALLASVRDILNPPAKAEKAAEALERLAAYDRVLVHGDKSVAPLRMSWPVGDDLARRLVYTGYIADDRAEPASAASPAGAGDVLVTGGGSAASLPLYRVALEAAQLAPPSPRWRILVGHGVGEAEFAGLVAGAEGAAVVERARPDFPALLRDAAVVVSQAGYNTVVDIAQARARAVLVPFEEGNEREQALRAGVWETLGLATVVRAADLSPRRLAAVVGAVLGQPRPDAVPLDCDGLAQTVTAVEAAAAEAAAVNAARIRLLAALDEVAARGRRLELWWRDDDAVEPGPALDRLLDLSRRLAAPLGLAVIPRDASDDLARRIAAEPTVRVLQHGFAHANHAPHGEKKVELGHAPLAMLLEELRTGADRLARLFGDRAMPVLVPPWNRIDAAVVQRLPALGFAGLSTFRPRTIESPAAGLVQVNTHWDPIAWRAGGGLANRVALLDALAERAWLAAAGRTDPGEPFGILTHHLVQDGWTWRFLEEVLALLVGRGRAVFRDPAELFA